MRKVLACIDASTYATSVCDHAAWAATRMQAGVDVLHIIPRTETARHELDLSGAIGLGASEALAEELVRTEEAQARVAQERGRAMLEGAQRRIREAGVDRVETIHRHGEVVETVTELEAGADLVVIGKRGETRNFVEDHLGGQVERVIRSSIRPVLVVPRVFLPVRRLLVAFDGGESARRALQFVAAEPGLADLEVKVVTVGTDSPEVRSRLDWARDTTAHLSNATVELVSGQPVPAIRDRLGHMEGELLVMGAYGHSRIRELILGSTTTAMIRTAKVPVLLFR